MQHKNKVEALALERIYRLFELAAEEKKPARAKRYIELARKLSSRNKTRIPPELKKEFCKKCCSPKVKTLKEKTWLVITCQECGFQRKARDK